MQFGRCWLSDLIFFGTAHKVIHAIVGLEDMIRHVEHNLLREPARKNILLKKALQKNSLH